MEAFHVRLKNLRQVKGLKATEVANQIEVPPSTYREWEAGSKIMGGEIVYLKLAKCLEVSVLELLSGEKVNRSTPLELIERIERDLQKLKEILLCQQATALKS